MWDFLAAFWVYILIAAFFALVFGSLLAVGLLERRLDQSFAGRVRQLDIDGVRRMCIFTTHTPVPAGHDQFPKPLVKQLLGDERMTLLDDTQAWHGEALNMTYLALSLSNFVNGVAKLHGEVSRKMFPNVPIEAITNGVHAATWACPSFRELFDRMIPSWREDNYSLRGALGLPPEEVWAAHLLAKHDLLETVRKKTGLKLDPEAFTIGFARRATGYKRADLILSDLDRLRQIAKNAGAFQLVYAGKAHPRDGGGKEIIKKIFKAKKALKKAVTVVFLDDYNLDLGGKLTSGGDLWLNTPQYPLEASGTSGMKAALNGVPSLSILDGWWVEGNIEGVTGWAIGDSHRGDPGPETPVDNAHDAESLYSKLEGVILPLYYGSRERYLDVMRHAIAINGSFFNTQRMVQQYITDAYLR